MNTRHFNTGTEIHQDKESRTVDSGPAFQDKENIQGVENRQGKTNTLGKGFNKQDDLDKENVKGTGNRQPAEQTIKELKATRPSAEKREGAFNREKLHTKETPVRLHDNGGAHEGSVPTKSNERRESKDAEGKSQQTANEEEHEEKTKEKPQLNVSRKRPQKDELFFRSLQKKENLLTLLDVAEAACAEGTKVDDKLAPLPRWIPSWVPSWMTNWMPNWMRTWSPNWMPSWTPNFLRNKVPDWMLQGAAVITACTFLLANGILAVISMMVFGVFYTIFLRKGPAAVGDFAISMEKEIILEDNTRETVNVIAFTGSDNLILWGFDLLGYGYALWQSIWKKSKPTAESILPIRMFGRAMCCRYALNAMKRLPGGYKQRKLIFTGHNRGSLLAAVAGSDYVSGHADDYYIRACMFLMRVMLFFEGLPRPAKQKDIQVTPENVWVVTFGCPQFSFAQSKRSEQLSDHFLRIELKGDSASSKEGDHSQGEKLIVGTRNATSSHSLASYRKAVEQL